MIDLHFRARSGAMLVTSAIALVAALPNAASATTCNSANPCAVYQNSNGIAIQGVSSKNSGVEGQTKNLSGVHAGLLGIDLATNNGVNDGVLGTVTNGGWGVAGTSGTGAFGGVFGSATNGYGVRGSSATSIGTYGSSTSSIGAYGSSSTYYGGYFTSGSGTGLAAVSSSGDALDAFANGGIGAYIKNSNGNGTDISGSYIGIIGRSDQYPIVLTDQASNDLFWVTGTGDVYVHGTYHTFARTRAGQAVTAFTSSSTTPNVEDVGSAQLVNGTANVRLDPALAASIDAQSVYHVFLTPNGDTRGLFVATKTPTGFIVRETQGGHGNIAFDYRIVATALGQSHQRMSLVNASASGFPRTALAARNSHAALVAPKSAQQKGEK